MSAQALTTARPPRAAIAWAHGDSIFVEIPCKGAVPYITRYRKTAEGLAAALNIICETPEVESRTLVQVAHPSIRRPKPVFDEAERQGVRDVLKKLNVI
jgi:hypothetical protein